jgi:amino acid adenylation domain-containing protein
MTTIDFLRDLRSKRVSVRLKANNQLSVSSNEESIDPAVIQAIRTKKTEIIRFLQTENHAASAIPKAEPKPYYEASQAQKRLWLLDQMEEGFIAYNIPSVHYIKGQLDVTALQAAFRALVHRHESLRTTFDFKEEKVVQVIHPAEEFPFELEYEQVDTALQEGDFQKEVICFANQHQFDLSQGPLLKAKLYGLSEDRYVLAFIIHHIISDAWSIRVMLKEIAEHYSNDSKEPEPLKLQYKDLACWQNDKLREEAISNSKDYWCNKFEGELPVLSLNTDFQRPAKRSYKGAARVSRIDPAIQGLLRKMEKEEGSTRFSLLLASVQAFLSNYTGDEDIIVGTTSNGRHLPELQDQLGFYVNLLPIRHQFQAKQSFRSLLAQTSTTIIEALRHEEYPFNLLLDQLNLPINQGRNPLFDVLVEHIGQELNEDVGQLIPGLQIDGFPLDVPTSKFDLSFRFIDSVDGIDLNLEYDSALFSAERIQSITNHFFTFLKNALLEPDRPINQISSFPASEKQLLLEQFNPPIDNELVQKPLMLSFQETAKQKAETTAVMSGVEKISYADLDKSSDQLAYTLQTTHGIKAGDRVAIFADRSINTVVDVWGILKSGAAFIPIDTAQPSDRIAHILNDSESAALLLESNHLLNLPEGYEGKLVVTDLQAGGAEEGIPKGWTAHIALPDDTAYLIYTSGSTGMPKGVQVAHRNIIHYLYWANQSYFNESSGCSFGLFTSIAFDLSLTGLMGTLLRGDTLHLYPDQLAMHEVLTSVFDPSTAVKAVKLTPSHISLLRHCSLEKSNINLVITGGEVLKADQLQLLFQLNPNMKVYNEYGPTETTVGCTLATFTNPDQHIHIGSPIDNTAIYILDEQQQLVPYGKVGEIYIGGLGVAQGYWNNPQLSSERFLPDPFGSCSNAYMYRSGDLGTWLGKGQLQFWGRKDDQIKIRGYRIEIGEIENALESLATVQQSLVMCIQNEHHDDTLVSYIKTNTAISAAELRTQLEGSLPVYMIPALFYQVSDFPLTQNGKVDRAALLQSKHAQLLQEEEFIAPSTKLESWLLDLFQPIISTPHLSISDNLFTIGLDSLKVVAAQNQIEEKYPGRIKIHEIFSNPTIQKMAVIIDPTAAQQQTKGEDVQILDF